MPGQRSIATYFPCQVLLKCRKKLEGCDLKAKPTLPPDFCSTFLRTLKLRVLENLHNKKGLDDFRREFRTFEPAPCLKWVAFVCLCMIKET